MDSPEMGMAGFFMAMLSLIGTISYSVISYFDKKNQREYDLKLKELELRDKVRNEEMDKMKGTIDNLTKKIVDCTEKHHKTELELHAFKLSVDRKIDSAHEKVEAVHSEIEKTASGRIIINPKRDGDPSNV